MSVQKGGNTWSQVANEQAWNELENANINLPDIIENYDPVYDKLVEQISKTIYHKLSTIQNWGNLGTTNPVTEFPGMIREILMLQRKGSNFPMDADIRPATMYDYPITNDDIVLRYHSTQIRWIYDYTIFDEELRRFSGGGASTILQLTEQKAVNMITARNMFMDAFRKKLMQMLIDNVAIEFVTGIDISDFENLTTEQAKQWLVKIDGLLRELHIGTTIYNTLNQFMQIPKSRLQMVIPYDFYKNVLRRAYPDTYNTETFKGILPENLILIDNLGTEVLYDGSGVAIDTPIFDAKGMNLLNWQNGYSTEPTDTTVQALIMDRGALTFEDNLSLVMSGHKDIRKLVTPVASHFWTRGWFTDLVPSIKITSTAVEVVDGVLING